MAHTVRMANPGNSPKGLKPKGIARMPAPHAVWSSVMIPDLALAGISIVRLCGCAVVRLLLRLCLH